MTDEYILEKGYKQYNPTPYDDKHIVSRFQKRFDDEYGKRYFIDVVKWSNNFIPVERRTEYWQPYDYEYQVQISMHSAEDNPVNLHFFSSWTLNRVEEFMAEFFAKMRPNYYELWDE